MNPPESKAKIENTARTWKYGIKITMSHSAPPSLKQTSVIIFFFLKSSLHIGQTDLPQLRMTLKYQFSCLHLLVNRIRGKNWDYRCVLLRLGRNQNKSFVCAWFSYRFLYVVSMDWHSQHESLGFVWFLHLFVIGEDMHMYHSMYVKVRE